MRNLLEKAARLAQVSARTGGLASSYAHSASQQTYNNYMAALADKIPELRQLAYSMYLDDLSQDRQDLSMLQGLDSSDYDRYLEALGQWNTDRDFAYDAHRDTVSDDRWQTQFDYAQAQDALAQKNYEQEVAYHQQQDALDRAQAQQKTAGEQYQQVLSVLEQMVQRGASRTDLQQALEDAYGSGLLNDELRRQLERRYLA